MTAATALLAFVAATSVLAQPTEPPPAEGTETPEAKVESVEVEITVVGDRLEESLAEDLSDYGSRLEKVSSEQVDEGGFVDVSQVLGLVPGLYVSQQNGPFDYVNVSLQGSSRQEVLWLVDGVRISNRLYDTTPPLDTLPASIVERVEVLKGGQGLFYGTQAVGGVINVVTKEVSERARRPALGRTRRRRRHALNGYGKTGSGDIASSSTAATTRPTASSPSATPTTSPARPTASAVTRSPPSAALPGRCHHAGALLRPPAAHRRRARLRRGRRSCGIVQRA